MPPSRRQDALRAFARVLLPLMRKYSAARGMKVSCDSSRETLLKVYRLSLLRAHPDKGGSRQDTEALLAAREALKLAEEDPQPQPAPPQPEPAPPQPAPPPPMAEPSAAPQSAKKRPAAADGDATRPKAPREAPPPTSATSTVAISHQEVCEFCEECPEELSQGYRIRSNGALLTWNGKSLLQEDTWAEFVDWVENGKTEWRVKHYCGTREMCRRRRAHLHLMVQFTSEVDCRSSKFTFRGIKPNARPAWRDYCGGGRNKKDPQSGLDRGFFYVWANKIGTCTDATGRQCVHGNYAPVWTDERFRYEAKGDWSETLWRRRQLTHDMHNEYVIRCRDRVPARIRNLQEVMEGELSLANKARLQEDEERVRQNPEIYGEFHKFEVIEAWLSLFGFDALRYPICIVFGPSHFGKTELAKSWFRKPLGIKVCHLVHIMPQKMRELNREVNDGIVFDDVRDLDFLVQHQHALQGKPGEEIWFAETEGGTRAYSRNLFKLPMVATVNKSTKNLHFLESDDFLGNPKNRVVLRLTKQPFDKVDTNDDAAGDGAGPCAAAAGLLPLAGSAHSAAKSPREVVQAWGVKETCDALREHDLRSAANILEKQDFNGEDLCACTTASLTTDLRMTAFHAEKVVRFRDALLS